MGMVSTIAVQNFVILRSNILKYCKSFSIRNLSSTGTGTYRIEIHENHSGSGLKQSFLIHTRVGTWSSQHVSGSRQLSGEGSNRSSITSLASSCSGNRQPQLAPQQLVPQQLVPQQMQQLVPQQLQQLGAYSSPTGHRSTSTGTSSSPTSSSNLNRNGTHTGFL